MAPRTEFFAINAGVAFVLATLGYLWLFHGGALSMWGRGFVLALVFTVPAAIAAALGTWFALASHTRALRTGARWTANALNLRMVLASLAILPLAMGLSLGIVELASNMRAPSLSDATYVTGIGLVVGLAVAVSAAIPAFIIEFFVCRRYLRRTAVVTTGSA